MNASFIQNRTPFVETAHELLLASSEYRRYRRAFEQTTGVPLDLVPAQGMTLEQVAGQASAKNTQPSFCMLMASLSPSCLACLEEERRVIAKIGRAPADFTCFPGLKRAAVPIWTGETLVALLQIGPVLLESPTPVSTLQVQRQALRRGVAKEKLSQLLCAYEATPVLPPQRNESALQLLGLFAEHLATVAERTLGRSEDIELSIIEKAKRIIDAEHARELPLTKIARAVGLSPRHFSGVFHQATGETFTNYLARVRVEQAKSLLNYPHLGVGQIAYKTGFRSLSQFNRTFRRLVGTTPSAYREDAWRIRGQLSKLPDSSLIAENAQCFRRFA